MSRPPVFDSDRYLLAANASELKAMQQALMTERYRADPVGWMNDVMGERPWSRQREIANSVRDNRYTVVPACHDSGKSWCAAALACWWIAAHPLGKARVVTSAPTQQQVESILWEEMRRMHRAADLPGKMGKTEWSIDGQLVAFGRKPSDYAQAVFQGIHGEFVLVILDEACGISANIWTAAETQVTSESSRMLAIGNPDDASSPFAKVCAPNSGWKVIRIPAHETPNFTGEKVAPEVAQELLSKLWVKEHERWEGTALWSSKILAEFPDDSEDTLIKLSLIQRACERTLSKAPESILGVDVGRHGTSETVIVERRGDHARVVYAHAGRDLMQTVGAIQRFFRGDRTLVVKVDDIGVGGGVVDRLKQLKMKVIGLNGGRRPKDQQRFVNARAEWWWHLREIFEAGDIDIDPNDEVLLEQLSSVRFGYDQFNRIFIESKDDMRKRGLSSPDRADALVLAFADVDMRQRVRITRAIISR